MLGISAGLNQRTITDFKKPTDYVEYLFTGIKGWICRGQIASEYKQSMFHFNGLMQRRYAREDNVYISMNTFFKNERKVDCLKRLNALYVDIDCYKLEQDKAAVLAELQDSYFESIIPTPTFVIDSGRGLYLIWKLRNEDRNALPRWTKVQNYLIEALKSFGADPACRDSARILRIPFSCNTKSGTEVTIREFNDITYSIYEIQQEYGITEKKIYKRTDGEKTHPYNTATEPMRRYAMQLALKLDEKLPDFNNFMETRKWIAKMKIKASNYPHREESATHFIPKTIVKTCRILQGYCDDMETLFSMRNGADCKREIALFLYRLFNYDMTGDRKLALKRTLAFNASLSCPLEESYVIRATRSAERKIDKGGTYHYKRATIIEVLEITSDEMQYLTYLVGNVNKRERKQENNRKAYLDRLVAEGKETKAESREKRRSAIISMQKDGKTAQEIMKGLSISKATYYREMAIIAARNGLEVTEDIIEESAKKVIQKVETNVRIGLNTIKKTIETNVKKISKRDLPTSTVLSQKISSIIMKARLCLAVWPPRNTRSGRGKYNRHIRDGDLTMYVHSVIIYDIKRTL